MKPTSNNNHRENVMQTPKLPASLICTALLASMAMGQAAPTLQVTAPTAGQTLAAGTTATITWYVTNPVGFVDIQLMKVDTAATVPFGVGYVPMAAGQFNWEICPALGDGDYVLRLTGDTAAVSADSAMFSVAGSLARPTVAITYPLGGESMAVGTAQVITWTSTNPSGQVYVDLLRDGQVATTLAYLPMSTGQYSWTPCNSMPTDSTYSIRVWADGCGDGIEAVTSTFSITGTPGPALMLTQPVGGEVWAAGTAHIISWDPNKMLGWGTVKLELLKNGQWYADIGNPAGYTAGFPGGQFTWSICPNIGDGSDYSIQASTTDACGKPVIVVTPTFTIMGSAPQSVLSLLQPTGGDIWAIGGPLGVKWEGNPGRGVVADLLVEGEWYGRLGVVPLANGTFNWTIPASTSASSNWQVTLRSTACGRVFTAESQEFAVAPAQSAVSPVAWRSVRTHSGAGELGIALDPAATGSSAVVESRGLRTIEVEFDGPIILADPAAVSITGWVLAGGTLAGPTAFAPTAVTVGHGNTLVIACDLPDAGCYQVTLGPTTLTASIGGDTDCMVRTLLGDADGSGTVDSADLSEIRSRSSDSPVSAPRLDITLSAGINVVDMALVKSRFGSYVLCP